jgi:feruloyl esterase
VKNAKLFVMAMVLIIAPEAVSVCSAQNAPAAAKSGQVVLAGVAPDVACTNLKNLKLSETTILSGQLVPAGGFKTQSGPGGGRLDTQNLPAFCRVVGVVNPAINFEVWLPSATGEKHWNGKFNGVGTGDLAGFINYEAMIKALARGYATASTDTGHVKENETWALGHPELLVDYVSRGIHMTARAGKAVTEAYYGEAPAYSYFTGCSGGGDHALSEAQRYPADYDGIVAGAPPISKTHKWPGELYAAWVTHRNAESFIPPEKLPMISKAALEACDGLDGIKDGVLDDPRKCHFDPAALLCPGADAPTCLTAGQVDSVKKIYEGWKDPSTGKPFWFGYERSTEKDWGPKIVTPYHVPVDYYRYMAFQDPDWNWKSVSFADPHFFTLTVDASRRLGPMLDCNNPDLTALKKLGGKLIIYSGYSDSTNQPLSAIQYFENMQEFMRGEKATQDFARLFMAPGMGHCGGGPGPNVFDTLTSLEQWVEKGKAPERIIATHSTNGKVDRSRPLCPYPQVARYKGTGSTDDAANFVCTSEERTAR